MSVVPTPRATFVALLVLGAVSLAIVLAEQSTLAPASSVADRPLVPLLAGCALALVAGVCSRAPAKWLGIAALAGFPLWAIGDLVLRPGPHDGPEHGLLPFEFAFYGVYMALGVLCAAIGRWLQRAGPRASRSAPRP